MIYDTLKNIAAYKGISAHMDRAIDFILNADFDALPAERFEVDGDNVFGFIQEPVLRDAADAQFEAHRKYADIQIALTDGEIMGILPLEKVEKWDEFNAEKDIGFSCVQDKGVAMPLNAKEFMILFPQDAHMPCLKGCAEKTRKVVIKVKV